jgi:8-amino-7-oxononanoate synthase
MLGSPALYQQIEERLVELLGVEDALLLPTLTHIHAAVIPLLADQGTIFVDSRAHKTIYDGAVVARAHGASLHRFPHGDPEALEELLHRHPKAPRLVCMDGVNSMTGNPPDLKAFAGLARAHDALLYLDDAHGFGVIGERSRDKPCPYGRRGNGVVRHLGETYDHLVLTGGFSKAYSSLLAFIAGPSALKRPAQGRRTAVPVLGAVADRLAGQRPGRPPDQRHPRRPAPRRAVRPHPAGP